MANLATILAVPIVETRLFSALFRGDAISEVCRSLSSLNSASRELHLLLNDEFIVKLFSNKLFVTLNSRFQHAKIQYLINNNYWKDFQACKYLHNQFAIINDSKVIELVTKYNGMPNSRNLVKEHLFCAVKAGSTEFVSKLLEMRIQNSSVQFPKKSLIRSLEWSINKKNNAVAIILLPFLQAHFQDSDPDRNHFQRLVAALKNNEQLNPNSDVFYRLKKTISSRAILDLVTPQTEKKIIIPEGKLLVCNSLWDGWSIVYCSVWGHSYASLETDYYRYYSTALRWIIGTKFKGSYNISYYDNKAIRHEFEFPKTDEHIYTYEGISTKNIYELIVRTSMGAEFLRSFPHRFVAVTDRALQLPLENQPWYFGNISNEEAQEVLYGAAGNNFFITLSRGLQFYICWSEAKRSQTAGFLKMQIDASNLKKFVETAMIKLNGVFGIYNNDSPKDVKTFKFLRILGTSGYPPQVLELAKKFKTENNLEISKIKNPSPLWIYLEHNSAKKLSDVFIRWLIDENVDVHGDEKPSIMALAITKKGYEYGKYLLSLGVKCDASAFVELLGTIPHRDEFTIFWKQRKNRIDIPDVLSKLLSLTSLYENRWGDGRSGEKKRLMMLAWKFGNADNLFKLLPKEILQLICQYDIDVPHWYTIGGMILADLQGLKVKLLANSIEALIFIAKYRNSFHETTLPSYLERIFCLPQYFQDRKLPNILRTLRKIDPHIRYEYKSYTYPGIVHYCVKDPDLLSALFDTKILDKKYLQEDHLLEPVGWIACRDENKAVIELCCKYDLVPLEYRGKALQQYLEQQNKSHIYEFVLRCIEENKNL